MMAAHANIGWASFRDRAWSTSTMSDEDRIAEARSEVSPILYAEPVDDWAGHLDGGISPSSEPTLLPIDGRSERHNIDYLTLIKQDGGWKFLTDSHAAWASDGEVTRISAALPALRS
jgi:hypothetical protein